MTSMEDRYYSINRSLLKSIGLWPYQEPKSARIRAAFVTIMYLSALFVQLAVFITHEFTMDIAIKVLSFVCPTIFILFIYYCYFLKSDKIKEIMERINYDWKSFKTKAELDIMDDYGAAGKFFSEMSSICLCLGIIGTLMCHIVPITLDIVSPVNVSRAQDLHVLVEYFVDPSKYYMYCIVHLTTFVAIEMLTAISIGVAMYSHGLHICALFKVANYRIEIMIDEDVLRTPSPERENIIYERITRAVNVHQRAILFNKFIVVSLEKSFFIMTAIGVISLSINLFRLLNALKALDEIIDIFIPSFMIFFHFCYLFFGNHVGQQMTDNSAEIFNTIYSLPWYLVPVKIQKLLLFLLQNSTKNVYLSIGGVINTSYESFSTLTRLSISYFTVLYTVQ